MGVSATESRLSASRRRASRRTRGPSPTGVWAAAVAHSRGGVCGSALGPLSLSSIPPCRRPRRRSAGWQPLAPSNLTRNRAEPSTANARTSIWSTLRLSLNGSSVAVGGDFLVQLRARRIAPDDGRPHGIDDSLVLLSPEGKRVVACDNAHARWLAAVRQQSHANGLRDTITGTGAPAASPMPSCRPSSFLWTFGAMSRRS